MIHRALVLVGILLSDPSSSSSQQTPPDPPALVTVGSAEIRLPPDRALLTIGIESRGRTAASAAAANVRPVRQVRDTLAALGFARDSVVVRSYSVQPNEDYSRAERVVGYEAATTLEVRLRALPRLGELFDAVLGAGATSISRVQFESDTAEASRRHALGMALSRARADAGALAAAAGGRLGRLLGVTTSPGTEQYDYSLDARVRLRGAASLYSGGAPVVSRDVVVSVFVQAKWEFLPDQ